MQAIYNIPQICYLKGIHDAVISPGSRSAPLTIAFARHKEIKKIIIPDERSAAFTALGMSRITGKTTALICTSGSAAYNYAPAVAEAFYQQIPLLILTADRPPEWVDQLDGQTIRQNGIYGQHVKASYTLPSDINHPDVKWHAERIINEAINTAIRFPSGPVHINIPLREPFYPEKEIVFSKDIKIIEEQQTLSVLKDEARKALLKELQAFSKILIVAGQSCGNNSLRKILSEIDIPVVTDVISNLQSADTICYHDHILTSGVDQHFLKPDLLITFGNSVISKSLKTFLRKNKPTEHWHIQEGGSVADTFQGLSRHIALSPEYFFSVLSEARIASKEFRGAWVKEDSRYKDLCDPFFNTVKFSEFEAVHFFMNKLPENSVLHLANSMPVRYANYIGLQNKKNIEVVANRGTSGIDGVISTAYGTALSTDKIVSVITGDMSFIYDRNAFWNNHLPSNLRILILNNHGGGIFRMIDGPSSQPEGEEYFVTRQMLTAENTMKDFDLDYSLVRDKNSFEEKVKTFFDEGRSKILEVETDGKMNTEVWKQFKKFNQ